MATRLKRLTVGGFRSFVEPATVSFPDAGLMLVSGRNTDTGGSSGSGKSSFNLAITYGLGFCPFPATDLRSWGSDKAPSVELVLDTPQGELAIKRGARLVATLAGETLKGGAKLIEERIQQVLGSSPEILGLLTYRGQKRPGLFLAKTDGEKKEFLTKVLGLEAFELAVEEAQGRIGGFEVDLGAAEQRLTTYREERDRVRPKGSGDELRAKVVQLEAAVASGRARHDDLADRIRARKASRLEKAAAAGMEHEPAIQAARKALEQIQGQPVAIMAVESDGGDLLGLLKDCRERLVAAQAADAARKAEARARLGKIQAEIDTCMGAAGRVHLLQRQLKEREAEYDKLKADVCPTCDRTWDRAQAAIARLEGLLASLRRDLAGVEGQVAALPRLQAKAEPLRVFDADPAVAKLQEAEGKLKADLAARLERIASQMALARSERLRAIAVAEADLRSAEAAARDASARVIAAEAAEVDEMWREAGTLRSRLDAAEKALAERERDLAEFCRQHIEFDRYQILVDQLETETRSISHTLKAEKDFVDLVGNKGFLGAIFDEVLAEISDDTNRILASVANTADCTLVFRSEVTTQKGTTNRKIVPVVSIRGNEAHLSSGPSGGMGTTIELAVDLALGAVISRRTGTFPGWLILDECFEGLGSVEKGSCMEILQRYAQDRLILVTDHLTEFQSLFTRSIPIVFSQGQSSVGTV